MGFKWTDEQIQCIRIFLSFNFKGKKTSIKFRDDGKKDILSKFNQKEQAQKNKSQRQLFHEEDEAMEPVMEVEAEGFVTPKPTNLLDVIYSK